MSTRIRLQRHGKKGKPFYHIVVADSRSKRDGRFIEKLGTYNPNTDPATIDLDFDRSVHWVSVGASPSDTTKNILSYTGVLMKEHLMRGVTKGALTEEQMEAKFSAWKEHKTGIIDSKVSGLAKVKAEAEKARMAIETEVKEARAAAIAAANTPPVEEVEEAPVEDATEAPAAEAEAAPAEVAAEEAAPVAEAAPAEEAAPEAPAEEAKAEAPAEDAPKGDDAPKEA
ncbi:MAG TPA: 30S ribosomal protein S16 [Flavobacteriales bacterium]|jgi:small subunit ribosomal protein S16|nr:30S ribosomal protein S16 [Flavobacteriales bacterium]HAW18674.1 30S ribosomal protein S16 [Flavobacteriales bacterium]